MKTIRLSKLKKLFEVMEIRRVKVFVHWSVLLIGAIILLGALEEPLLAFTVLGAYYGVILLHECGHMVAAQRKGCTVWSIELYPLWGIRCFGEPYSRYDHCIDRRSATACLGRSVRLHAISGNECNIGDLRFL
jgi:hypothetical protein